MVNEKNSGILFKNSENSVHICFDISRYNFIIKHVLINNVKSFGKDKNTYINHNFSNND